MKIRRVIPLLFLGLVLTGAMSCGKEETWVSQAAKPVPVAPPSQRITSSSAGPIRIGMTVAEARKAMPEMAFARTQDGDGVALVEVKRGEALEMMLYAGESDTQSPIDENARIEAILVWGPGFATVEGVHPGTPLREAEAKYGKVTKIRMSEIESREYAEFAHPPAALQFRVGLPDMGRVGTYPEGSLETTTYAPNAVVSQIEIYK